MPGLDDLVTYLRLAPEFGGTRFGPFEGLEVRLGSNAERCHIVLPESLGVVSEHCKLIRQGPKNLILAPAERTATVFLYKSGEHRPRQLATPTAVVPGDAFALVTPDGPRFHIELDELPPEIQAQREEMRQKRRSGVGRGRLSADSMGKEIKRQAWTRLLVMGPLQLLQRASVYIRSGAIYQPRNIILGATIAAGWIFGGAMSCASCRSKSSLKSTTVKYENCQQDLSLVEGMSDRDSTAYNFSELAVSITRSNRLGTALENDADLRAEAKKRARTVLANSKEYRWLIKGDDRQASQFADWRESVEESGLDDDTKRLVTWLAAMPGKGRQDWDAADDSRGSEVCGRGPLRMTYRQAVHLGIRAQPDYLHIGSPSSIESTARREELLTETIDLAQQPPFEPPIETDFHPVMGGTGYCLYITEDDERSRIRSTVRALEEHLGPDAPGVPSIGNHSSSTTRIAKYWAADLVTMDYEHDTVEFEFSEDSPPGATLAAREAKGQWVLGRTAQVIAHAVVLPCLAVLEGDKERVESVLGEESVPNPVHCLVLNWKLQHES